MIEIIDDDAALAALGPEWDALWRATPSASPFQSPRWLLPWWRQFGTGVPRVATMRRGGALVAALPLYILPEERKALLIGSGTTDYLDGIGDAARLLPALLDRLATDLIYQCDLIDVPAGSALSSVRARGWQASWQDGNACPVLTLPGVPSGIKRKLRMSRHRAERAGGLSVETADAETLSEFLSDLVRLHQARWTTQGEAGVLCDPKVLAFWRQAAPSLLEGGLLRLQRLRIGGQVAAVIVALLAPGRICFYLSGFDETHSFVSPGTLLLGAMLDQAAAEARTEVHFLRGQEGYKYAWGAVDRFNRNGRLTRD